MQCGQVNSVALKNYLKENLFIEKIIFYKNKPLQRAYACWNPWLQLIE